MRVADCNDSIIQALSAVMCNMKKCNMLQVIIQISNSASIKLYIFFLLKRNVTVYFKYDTSRNAYNINVLIWCGADLKIPRGGCNLVPSCIITSQHTAITVESILTLVSIDLLVPALLPGNTLNKLLGDFYTVTEPNPLVVEIIILNADIIPLNLIFYIEARQVDANAIKYSLAQLSCEKNINELIVLMLI